MTNEVTKQTVSPEIIQRLVLDGDLSRMQPAQKVDYYNRFCQSLGLNPLTQPFQIIKFQGKEKLYATKDCTEQLRKIHGVSITEVTSQQLQGIFVVTAKAQDKNGKTDAATGAVTIEGLKGDALANALMKAETKAKRRVTLSICGLGMLDESELETMPAHTTNKVDERFDEVVSEEDKALLRQMVFTSTLSDEQKETTLAKIELCTDYKQYQVYMNKLESVQQEYNDVANPSATDAKKFVKKITGKKEAVA